MNQIISKSSNAVKYISSISALLGPILSLWLICTEPNEINIIPVGLIGLFFLWMSFNAFYIRITIDENKLTTQGAFWARVILLTEVTEIKVYNSNLVVKASFLKGINIARGFTKQREIILFFIKLISHNLDHIDIKYYDGLDENSDYYICEALRKYNKQKSSEIEKDTL
jgi:hypothetical protein